MQFLANVPVVGDGQQGMKERGLEEWSVQNKKNPTGSLE